MNELFASDLMAVMPLESPSTMAKDPEATARGLFALRCAIEKFSEVVDSDFYDLAEALYRTSCQLGKGLQRANPAYASLDVIPREPIANTFRRFDKTFRSLDDLIEHMADNWRAVIAWRNIQDRYLQLKPILVQTSLFYESA